MTLSKIYIYINLKYIHIYCILKLLQKEEPTQIISHHDKKSWLDDGGWGFIGFRCKCKERIDYKYQILQSWRSLDTKTNRVISDRRDGTRGVLAEERENTFTYMKQLERGNCPLGEWEYIVRLPSYFNSLLEFIVINFNSELSSEWTFLCPFSDTLRQMESLYKVGLTRIVLLRNFIMKKRKKKNMKIWNDYRTRQLIN